MPPGICRPVGHTRLLAIVLALLAPSAVLGQPMEVPAAEVHLEVTIRPEERALSGRLTLKLNDGDPRRAGPLWFHLPPNRFAEPDRRGRRRHLAPIPFAISYLNPEIRDPWLPDGFSEGSIRIVSVHDAEGNPLGTQLADNPRLPLGFATGNGLLRVDLPPGPAAPVIVIHFETRLPHRVVDGWSESAWLLAQWFPELARFAEGEWDLGVSRPSPVRYALKVRTLTPGWFATGRGEVRWLAANQEASFEAVEHLEKGFPLAFLPKAERTETVAGDTVVTSLHRPEGTRIAALSHRIVHRFLGHVASRFGIPPPAPGIVIVQADLPPEETLTLGNLVAVSPTFNDQTPFVDRVYVGTLAGALGQIWFGETVWADDERQAWLPYGVSGYLALDFFEALYGWDARIHTITDWLSPRFRENYFESPVRGMIRDAEDAPLLIPFRAYPRRHTALVVMHRKAALVLRSLSHVAGADAFAAALGTFYRDFRYCEGGDGAWQAVLQRHSTTDLAWFFDQWFRRTASLDYAIADWEQQTVDGRTRVKVRIARLDEGVMPVDVRVTSEDGSERTQRIDGTAMETELLFDLESPPVSIDLDPEEFLLEENRRNNHSDSRFRVRPFFDWSKQREILVNLRGRAGGNAVDGNYAGLGVNVALDVDNQVRFIPIYGEHTGWVNYDAGWQHDHFLHPRLSLELSAGRLGGLRNRALQVSYRHDTRDDFYASTSLAARAEEVDSLRRVDDGRVRSQAAGDANNLEISHATTVLWNAHWANTLSLSAEHGQTSYQSDFDYTLLGARLGQTLTFTPWHAVQLEVIRLSSAGQTPLQKQPLLGDPLVLRGYPRSFRLVDEQLAAARVEYRWTVTRAVIGREIQSRRIQLLLFQDIGKGWDNHLSPEDRPQRQDAGLGIEIDFNVAGLVTFPARVEVAMPYDDPQFKTARVVFFQALSFF